MIYKQYDQVSLDNQYNNRLHVPDFADYLNRWQTLSRETEKKLPVIKDIAYGSLSRERLDIYPSILPQAKTLIFIHGGYWQMLDKTMFQFVADAFHAYGVTIVLLSYPLAPDASIDQIVASCTKGLNWVYWNVSKYNGDPGQLYVAGHSAGAHLAAMQMTTDWKVLNSDLPNELVKGCCVISGLFNLVPIHLSYLNQVLKMDMETAKRNSPVNQHPTNSCPLIVAVGGAETQEFNDQSRELYESWKEEGIDIQLLQLPRLNHFSIVEAISDTSSALHLALCKLMKLNW